MRDSGAHWKCTVVCSAFLLVAFAACRSRDTATASASPPFMSTATQNPPSLTPLSDDVPVPDKFGGFDGSKAYEYTARQVGFGPRPAGSSALQQTREYILSQLKTFDCSADVEPFGADTPVGHLQMQNIIVKIPGDHPGIILLATHYDTLRMDNFVGADDGASSTGLMMEMARQLCGKHGRYAVWIVFFDGEEAQKEWSDLDSRYGSRDLAAKMAMNGDLKNIRAMLLADIVGGKNLQILQDSSSTPELTRLVWTTAQKLGYGKIFLNQQTSVEDDHDSFLKRGVPAVDVINDFVHSGYWHTTQDTMDKISAHSLAVVGHVLLETVRQLQEQQRRIPTSRN